MVGFELEILAKKQDRFGWERDRGTPAHDRIVTDWMDALQDYPLQEVRAACKAAILASPSKMPNEGHVIAVIMNARRLQVSRLPKPRDPDLDRPLGCSPEERERRIAFAATIVPKQFGAGSDQ